MNEDKIGNSSAEITDIVLNNMEVLNRACIMAGKDGTEYYAEFISKIIAFSISDYIKSDKIEEGINLYLSIQSNFFVNLKTCVSEEDFNSFLDKMNDQQVARDLGEDMENENV